ncbi:MAG: hypothetical protein EOP88_15250 [Verrucomicrobiaceae bacterium]|nr:MAG: hypothetical protein EOP88_15250 [Verrucomicrobiaceae bacterium]
MKTTLHFVALSCALALPVLGQAPAPAPADPFEAGMREAFTIYKKGDAEGTAKKLRELLKILDSKAVTKLGTLLPDALGDWKAEALKTEDSPSGGVTMARTYTSGEKKVTIRVAKDSPQLTELLPLLVNEELLKLANRNVYKVNGHSAVMEGGNKLQVAVDERILVDLQSEGGATEPDLVDLAGKLDVASMAKIK